MRVVLILTTVVVALPAGPRSVQAQRRGEVLEGLFKTILETHLERERRKQQEAEQRRQQHVRQHHGKPPRPSPKNPGEPYPTGIAQNPRPPPVMAPCPIGPVPSNPGIFIPPFMLYLAISSQFLSSNLLAKISSQHKPYKYRLFAFSARVFHNTIIANCNL